MTEDPIVEEARRAGQAYVESFKGDRRALLADLRRRSREAGREPISLPPKPVKPPPAPAKKAG